MREQGGANGLSEDARRHGNPRAGAFTYAFYRMLTTLPCMVPGIP
jgi:hypothetical protein